MTEGQSVVDVRQLDDPVSRDWRLDKRIPIALIIGLLAQTFAFGWWAATLQANQDAMKAQIVQLGSYQERLVRVEAKLENANETLTRIDRKIEDSETRRR